MLPLISVCIPVYNTSNYLEQCLESLFNQTIADKCEFIIVNDCSTDNSSEILTKKVSEYKKLSIKIINHEKNKGLAAARNTALDAATGKYCINIDSDDWIDSNYIETLVTCAEKDEADLVNCCFKFLPDKNYDYIKGILKNDFPVTIWTRLIKRDLFINNNFRWVDGINVGEDVIISCKLFHYAKKIVCLNTEGYHYRTNIGFATKLKKLKWCEQKKKEFSELENFFSKKNILEKYKEILNQKKAEVKFDYIKYNSVFSLKKYKDFYPEQKLQILLEKRPDFNNQKTKLFIKLIDKGCFIRANFLILLYKVFAKNK